MEQIKPKSTTGGGATGFEQPANSNSKGGNFVKWVVVIIIIAIIIVGGLYLVSKYSRFNVLGISSADANWQAVFLTNGQVYFGKVVKETGDKVLLEDIYYLQVTQPLQPSGDQKDSAQQSELSLVKLGNELHGPKDKMRINANQVLFIEDLKTDSRVVEAINNYMQSQEEQ